MEKERRNQPRDNASPRLPGPGRVGGVSRLASQVGNRAFTSLVQRADAGGGPRSLAPDVADDIRTEKGGGRALDDSTRAEMEGHLGTDLSGVRVHEGSRADELSRSVQAEAFTTGNDVFFKSGKYSPASTDGRRLLAHELTHVVQQRNGEGGGESQVSAPGDPHEIEAKSVGDAVANSRRPPSPPPGSSGGSGLLRSVQRQAGNRAAGEVAGRIDRLEDRPAGRRVAKAGLVNHDGFDGKGGAGLNLRSAPSTSARVVRRIAHNAHVHIDVDVGNGWRYVQVTKSPNSRDVGEFGYMSAGHLYDEDRMPDPEATLHRITEGEQAQKLVARHYGEATTKKGEDERFYTNVLYHVNKQFGRNGVFKGPGIKMVMGRPVKVTETYLRAGSQIWMPGLAFARSLKGKVSSGSWARDTWEKIKGYAKYIAAGGAFLAGLVVGAVKSLIDLVKTVVVGLYNTAKSLGKNIVRAGRQIYGLFKDPKKRREFLYMLGDLADKWWDPDHKLGVIKRWWRRGQFIGYATAEVITGKLLATIAVKGAKLGAKAAEIVAWVASKSPKVAAVMAKVGQVAKSATVLKAQELVGATVTKVVDKGKTVYTVVKNNKVVRVVTAPARGGLKVVDGAGNVLKGGVKLTAAMLEASAKAAARKARLARIALANRTLRRAIVKGNPAKMAKAARNVLRRTGDFDAVRNALKSGKMGKGDDAIKAAGEALDNARKAELEAVQAKVKASIVKKRPDAKVEFYDSGKPGLGSDRDVTITVTKEGKLTPVEAKELAAESVRAVQMAENVLKRRGFKNPDRTLDTNYYTNLHEDVFTGTTKLENAAIMRDQTVTALAKMRMTMSNRQWRRFRKAQLKSVQPTDATRGIEKAVHKEMHTRLRDAERLAKKLAKDNLVRARRDLRKALTSKTPISDQELRRLMTRVKMLEPDSYGVRETVKGVTQLQQPLQRLAELKVIEQRLKAKQAQGGKLDKAEAAELARVEAELGTVRKKVAAALSRRAGRSTTSAHMHALAEEAIENAAMLWIHTAWRGNSFGGVKSAAKYHERVRHAYEAMGFKAVTGGPTDASFELMVKKMTGDLDAASADKALREWAVARDPKWAKASDQAIRDMFVRETRVHANQLSKQMHTRALSRDIANPDAANPPTIQGPKPAPKDGPDTGGAGGAAATGGHKPPPLNGLDNPHALDAPLDRTKPVGTTGYKGSLATRPGFGVFEGTLNGKPVLVKVYKDWGPMRGQMLREMEGARAAELTGYGPKVYGVVDVGTNPKKGVGFAMDRQPGGFIDAGAKTPETLAEAAQVRARVNEKTIAQMRDYGKKLVENGYVNKGELQFLVDKNGNLKPIDFQGVEKLSDDPTERARQLAGHRDSIDGGVSELETAMKKAKSGGGS